MYKKVNLSFLFFSLSLPLSLSLSLSLSLPPSLPLSPSLSLPLPPLSPSLPPSLPLLSQSLSPPLPQSLSPSLSPSLSLLSSWISDVSISHPLVWSMLLHFSHFPSLHKVNHNGSYLLLLTRRHDYQVWEWSPERLEWAWHMTSTETLKVRCKKKNDV